MNQLSGHRLHRRPRLHCRVVLGSGSACYVAADGPGSSPSLLCRWG